MIFMKEIFHNFYRYTLRVARYVSRIITSSHYQITPLIIAFLFVTTNVNAAYLKDVPVTLTQPNGDTLHCFASGDEFYNFLHDENGYTIIQNTQGYYMYAIYDGDNIVSSNFIAGTVNPSQVGLQPNITISSSEYQKRRAQWFSYEDIMRSKSSTRNQGKLNNLVVFIRFADEQDITKTFSSVENMYNNQTQGYNSMINYFYTTSYGKLTVQSHFFPEPEGEQIISYQDEHPRSYYMPYNESTNPNGYSIDDYEDRVEREHVLLRKAIEYIADVVPADLDIDYNNDGLVDNVCFVVRGNVATWSVLLWPHRWFLFSEEVYIHGKRVWDYNFMLINSLSYFNTAVLSHEMQHTFGFPDLYHYYFGKDLVPCGVWDVMESNSNPPQQSGAYMKWKYGNWLDEPLEIQPGTYTLNSVGSGISPVSYKIPSSNPKQFFVLEFRNKNNLFDKVPGTGLLIYRINTTWNGNAGYNPENNVFDEVYIFRPGGNSPISNGSILQAHFGVNGRDSFDEFTDPSPFLTNGTYVTDLSISDIIIMDDQVSFTYHKLLRINDNNISNSNISIQPNPATQYFEILLSPSYVTSNGITAQIYDVQGLLLKTEQLYDEKTRIDISNFVKGFYIVKIGKEAKKLIIK